MPEIRLTHVATTAVLAFLVAFVGARALAGERAADRGAATTVAGAGGWGASAATSDGSAAPGGGAAGAATGAADVAGAAIGGGGSQGDLAVSVDDPGALPAVVHVAGAVRRPGVYRLDAGARVADAVARAGGPRQGADLDAVNLAAKLVDGQQILVPRRGATAPTAPAAGTAGAVAGATSAPAAPLDLNAASQEQLETLDGVGPATAQKILAYRQAHGGFRSVDELNEVSGIGPKKLAALRGQVHV